MKKIVKKTMGLPKDSDDGVQAFSGTLTINGTNDDNDNGHRMDARLIRNEMKRITNEVIAPSLSEGGQRCTGGICCTSFSEEQ